MSTMQIRNFRMIKQILFQLKAFGLNPYDWKIDRSGIGSSQAFQIRHRTDEQFKFMGQWEHAKEDSCKLIDLSLLSL